MELELIRTYYPGGTNGKIFYLGCCIAYSIELPWKDNLAQVSCIPEGKYQLVKRYNLHFRNHFQVMLVKDRSLILLHPANDAKRELKGCIAPVSFLNGEGKGSLSREAMAGLITLTDQAIRMSEQVFLIIKSIP